MRRADIVVGSALDEIRRMAPDSVDCCVTSPPYFGLRDYGMAGQIGNEATPAEFVASLVAVFAQVRRVLKPSGTLWVNIGDSYAAHGSGCGPRGKERAWIGEAAETRKRRTAPPGCKAKDLLGVPWMLAFALRGDGWWLRSEVIWSKPNPMPESVRDRPTCAHEKVFMLSRSARYFYDDDAARDAGSGQASGNGFVRAHRLTMAGRGQTAEWKPGRGTRWRNVWRIAPQPCRDAHFAVMPPELARRCIVAGCPPGGVVLDPFAGAGTTGMVALQHGRSFVGIEMNPDYAAIARRRIEGSAGLFAVVA